MLDFTISYFLYRTGIKLHWASNELKQTTVWIVITALLTKSTVALIKTVKTRLHSSEQWRRYFILQNSEDATSFFRTVKNEAASPLFWRMKLRLHCLKNEVRCSVFSQNRIMHSIFIFLCICTALKKIFFRWIIKEFIFFYVKTGDIIL